MYKQEIRKYIDRKDAITIASKKDNLPRNKHHKKYEINIDKTLKCYIRTQKEDLNKWRDFSCQWKTTVKITKCQFF